jgi:hypothetical protein
MPRLVAALPTLAGTIASTPARGPEYCDADVCRRFLWDASYASTPAQGLEYCDYCPNCGRAHQAPTPAQGHEYCDA